jgi:S1-C subfamily serine protease
MITLEHEQSPVTDLLNADISHVAQATSDALVRVVSAGRGTGSGIVWDARGLIVTNAHVIGNQDVSVVTSTGDQLNARVLLRDEASDVAVLEVDASGLSPAPIGDLRSLRAGEMVFAFGYPWGISAAITAGVVLASGDDQEVFLGTDDREWLTVNMRLRPGNSGGPIVNSKGQVVGIATAMAGSQIGLAVPAHIVDAVIATTQGSLPHA